MREKIEIQIEKETYERLKKESVNWNMDMEGYLSMLIEKHGYSIKQNHNYIEEKVKRPLKKILNDLETLGEDMENNNLSNRVLLLSLKMYNKPLPKEFSRIIEYYKGKGWYSDANFYLITDGKSILGYLGLSISEEDAPYGKYLFIYVLNMYKDYQNSGNLNYIINFIQSIGRQESCYSIDIILENCNIAYDQLKGLGFLPFTSTDIMKVKVEDNDDIIHFENLKSEELKVEGIEGFLPVAKTEPLKALLSQWSAKKEKIEIYKSIYKDEGGEIEFIYVKEVKVFNKSMYNYFTLLVKSQYLYDDKFLYKVFSILKLIVSKSIDKDMGAIVMIPNGLREKLFINGEKVLDTLNWLRKNNS